MTRYTFEQVWAYREKNGKCPICGKRTARKWSDCMTVNPFNKNEDGSVKTRAQVRDDINAKADAWVPDFTHAKCRDYEGVER